MPLSLLSQWDNPSVNLQIPPLGILLLTGYVVLLVWIIWQDRRHLSKLSSPDLLRWMVFILLALIAGYLTTLDIAAASPFWLALLATVPVLLAGTVGVLPAILTGLVVGLTHGLWVSHSIFSLFEFSFWGGTAAWLVRQDYRGRLPRLLRSPIIAAVIASGLTLAVYSLSCASHRQGHIISSFIYCAESVLWMLPTLLAGSFLSGAVVQLLFLAFPSLTPTPHGARVPPYSRSLRNQLLFAFVPAILVVILVLFVVVTYTAIQVAINQSVVQAARDSENAAARIPSVLQTGQSLLDQLADDESQGEPSGHAQDRLARYIRTTGLFKELAILDSSLTPTAIYPAIGASGFTLSANEKVLAQRVIDRQTNQTSPVHRLEDGTHVITFLAPIGKASQSATGVLIGRADTERSPVIRDILNNLQGTMSTGTGFVIDERNLIILNTDRGTILAPWTLTSDPQRALNETEDSTTYLETDNNGNRWLVYSAKVEGSDWRTVIYIPYETILNQAAEISTPFVITLLILGVALIALIPILSTRLTHPVEALSKAASQIAQGKMDVPVTITGDDEVGHLGTAFETMRLSLNTRLKELSLLLRVSRAVSANLNLEGALEPILIGIMEATPAVYARIILVSSPGVSDREISVRRPARISWHRAKAFSGPLLRLARDQRAVRIHDTTIYPGLFSDKADTALGFPLMVQDRLNGVLVVEYKHQDDIATSELEFLGTLAGQAAVAIESARLFEEVESERRRLVTILTGTTDAILVTDSGNRVLLVNPAAQQAFDLPVPEIIGQSVQDLSGNPDLIKLLVAAAEDPAVATQEIALPDGRTLYASASSIGNDSDQTQGHVFVMRDITHLKEIDKMKSEFVSTVSHDLRSPLTYMKGYISLIISAGPLLRKQDEYLQKIRVGIDQMTELIDNLLDIRRIEAGIGVNMDTCQLNDILDDIVNEMSARANAKDIELILETSPELSPIIVDRALIRQAIANLVDNAIKYTPEGSVMVNASNAGHEVVVMVKDTGLGIPAADHPRLFEEFYRVKTRHAVKMRGSGLGLSIVKSIVALHGGRVWLESEVNKGSTFFIALPFDHRTEDEPA